MRKFKFKRWQLVAKKEIISADGYKTEYAWYTDGKLHVFMLGEGAKPDPEWCDWSEDTYEGAKKWYDQCNGWILDI